MKAPTGEKARRCRVVKGYAFCDFPKHVKAAIRHYVATGEMLDAFPDEYRELDKVVK